MILLDSDVMIDLFREYPPAKMWFDSINDSETMALSGFKLKIVSKPLTSSQTII